MTETLSDADLVARCRAGDPAAWRELVERYSRYVYAIARSFSLRDEDVEDVFQDVFARAYERLDTLRDDDALRPWLAQLTRRICIDRIRSRSREVISDEVEPEGLDERIEELTEALSLHEALASLSENCREILDRFFARDESYRTIGEALELAPGTIASRISRCLARLRERMEETGGVERLVGR
jgi:RNA polymerase sigma-70 factor, ECF subfamily